MEKPTATIDLDEDTAVQLAALFSTLGDPGRVRILAALLEQDLNVGELAERVGLSHSAVSHHLRHLRQMRLVRAQKRGRYVYYALDDEHVRDLFAHGLAHVRHWQ
jgi:DNA-binding transcriptional ArsR family regulator